MVAYTTAPGDVEMGGEQRTVVLVEKKSSSACLWRACGALLFAGLCFGGGLLFAWHWNGGALMLTRSGQSEARIEDDAAATEKTEPHVALKRISSKAKAAIHLEGRYNFSDTSPSSQLEWKSGQGQTFAQGGFSLVNNQIIIPHTGLYFVYSQASFRVSCSDEDDVGKHLMPLSHRIRRYSEMLGGQISLMSAVRSACQPTAQEDAYRDGHGWYNAIYLGAVFQLNGGDRLWTETNQRSELDTEEGKTFFGVFAL